MLWNTTVEAVIFSHQPEWAVSIATSRYWNECININLWFVVALLSEPLLTRQEPDRNPTGIGLGCAKCGQEVRMSGSVTQVSTDGAATWGKKGADISIIRDTVMRNLDQIGQAVSCCLTPHTHDMWWCCYTDLYQCPTELGNLYVLSILLSAKVCIPISWM